MDTLGIWIGLNFLETFLFYYLLFGTVIDRKTLKTKDKWILYFVLISTSTIISVWVKRSVFSAYGYLLTIFILVLGSFLAYRKKLILLTGIASMYEAAMMLFLYIIYYLLAFIYGNQAENPQILFFRYHENEEACVIKSLLLIISFFIIFKIRSWKKKKEHRSISMGICFMWCTVVSTRLGVSETFKVWITVLHSWNSGNSGCLKRKSHQFSYYDRACHRHDISYMEKQKHNGTKYISSDERRDGEAKV